jgi:hypothetical protein
MMKLRRFKERWKKLVLIARTKKIYMEQICGLYTAVHSSIGVAGEDWCFFIHRLGLAVGNRGRE